MNVRPTGPTTACLSSPTFLPSCLPPSRFPSCLQFCLPAYLVFYLLIYPPTFLSSCLPSIFSACLPSHLSTNLPVYLSHLPARPSQPVCACIPSRAPQAFERRWAVGLGVGAGSQDITTWSGVHLKHELKKVSYLCKLNHCCIGHQQCYGTHPKQLQGI